MTTLVCTTEYTFFFAIVQLSISVYSCTIDNFYVQYRNEKIVKLQLIIIPCPISTDIFLFHIAIDKVDMHYYGC